MIADSVLLFLCGDVMLGRGIDQILPHPSDPSLHEPTVHSALDYVQLAEAANGAIPRPVPPAYIWGDALSDLAQLRPAARIINLETSITRSAVFVPKGINYRMSPANVGALTAAAVDCCVLANNHVLDFGGVGLAETLATLHRAGVKTAGAGGTLSEAEAPAVIDMPAGGRVLVFAFGHRSSGIPPGWAAAATRPGIALLPDLSERSWAAIGDRMAAARRARDLAIASIHWGGNWGYEISEAERVFAHRLIDLGFAAVHGHSSHHPKAVEVYRDRPILYGCGDFLNDYEGIAGYAEFRSDLALMYLPRFCLETETLTELRFVPFRIARFRLERASAPDAVWLQRRLDRVCRPFGVATHRDRDGTLSMRWS